MGLAEKRIQQDFDTKKIPETLHYYSTQTKGATANLKLMIDWASFGEDKQAYDNIDSIWQQPLQGVEAVCADDLGKSGIQEKLMRIMIVNASGKPAAEFKDGTLTATMNFREGTNGSPGYTEFKKAIENGL